MKKIFLWFIFLSIVFFISTQVSKEFHSKVLYITQSIKIGFLNLNNNISNVIERHFNQAKQIKELSSEVAKKRALEYSYLSLKEEYKNLLANLQAPIEASFDTAHLVRTISYVKMNDYKRIWLEFKNHKDYKKNMIFGLVNENKVAGIATLDNNRLVGYLNGDEKCSYSVIIGEKKIPGIAKYDLNKGFIIDYIPLFANIEIGEKIYTSGYDSIFYPNIYVGEIASIQERQGHQIATLKDETSQTSQFYWLIDLSTPESSSITTTENATKTPANLTNSN
ncbi:rod shape-determining protein MreC [Helicobacter burdigaliensis]|uniref:rod shape-determining protein MreC n=1 Tax=Helicobacter burdigaliensis TaxID=2315334 RepID=UPI000EF70B84|nr:rod shape-determining protein MreC [Helicobacter burdigaliensis]